MGLILDSSVLIASERKGNNARQVLGDVALRAPGEEIAISVITLMELAHGAARADRPERIALRRQFVEELATAIPVFPVSSQVALRAGVIDGLCAARGTRIALADLLIGVTALELGYRLATENLRHFRAIPGLEVTAL